MKEIFHSLQGETSHVGRPNVFVRLTGCDLRCTYCDSAYAFQGGESLSVDEVLARVQAFDCREVLLTGGEPLKQVAAAALIQALCDSGFAVSIETHGQVELTAAHHRARIVLDVKTPGSGMVATDVTRRNLVGLKTGDEVKFVLTSKADYEWAKTYLREVVMPEGVEVLFSPAQPAPGQPGSFEGLAPRALAEAILRDRLPVRFQHQLHKWIWGPEATGV